MESATPNQDNDNSLSYVSTAGVITLVKFQFPSLCVRTYGHTMFATVSYGWLLTTQVCIAMYV